MSQVTGFKLQVEEYASQADWIERLLRPLNNFAQSTVNAVNGGLYIGENIVAAYKQVTAKIPAILWTNLTPQNSWTQTAGQPALSYFVTTSGQVVIQGAITAGTKTDGTIIFTMPSPALYPLSDTFVSIVHDDKSAARALISSTDGSVKIYDVTGAAATIYLQGVQWYPNSPPAPGAYVGDDWPIKLAVPFDANVAAVLLCQATDTETNQTLSAGTAGIDWEMVGRDEVMVKRVNGLTSGKTYAMKFLIIGG